MIVAARIVEEPRPHEVFSPNFLDWVAEGRLPKWWLVGEFLHHDFNGKRFVWKLIGPRRGTDWIEGAWPD